MKKILPIFCSFFMICPAFAEETVSALTAYGTPKDVKPVIESSVATKIIAPAADTLGSKSNPEIKFPRGMQLGLGVSATSGINGFIGYANKNFDSFWWKRLGVRLDFATTAPIESSINATINTAVDDNQDVGDNMAIKSVDVTARHVGVLVDFYPFGDTWFLGGWRLTGGYMTGKFGIGADLSGTIANAPAEPVSFELNDVDYRYAGNEITGRATGTWKYSGPYMGTGFDLGLLWGVKIYMDAGAVYTNKTAVMGLNVPLNNLLQVSTDGGTTWTDVDSDTDLVDEFNANKDAALKDANDDLGDYNFFPMVKLGLMYRF